MSDLIEFLAPIHSPTIIVEKLLRKYFKFEGNIAFIGPCLSKRREFKDPDTEGVIQFNLTFASIKKYLQDHKIDLNNYKESEYDFTKPERGCVFCKPGGFKNIYKRYFSNQKIRNYEDKFLYKKYFIEINNLIKENSKNIPSLIDVLNCSGGCYRGPASENNLYIGDELLSIEKKEEDSIRFYKNKAQKKFEILLSENKDLIFERVYFTDSAKPIHILPKEELKQEAIQTNKFEHKDFLNSQSCGFENCQDFSTALHYKLTVP